MSATDSQRLDYEEQIGRIHRMNSEMLKFQEETLKLRFEALKLDAEAMKLNRDRSLAPFLTLAGMLTGIAGIVVAVVTLLTRSTGH